MTEYTVDEQSTIRSGVLGTISLVSRADPGFIAAFRESFAGAKALRALPEELRQVVAELGMPEVVAGQELARLSDALTIVDAKDAEAGQALRDVVLRACEQVAEASEGVADSEKAVVDQVRVILRKSAPVEDTSGVVRPTPRTTSPS